MKINVKAVKVMMAKVVPTIFMDLNLSYRNKFDKTSAWMNKVARKSKRKSKEAMENLL